jgi:hypothetical protein
MTAGPELTLERLERLGAGARAILIKPVSPEVAEHERRKR